jgi:adenylyl-sulfate kinase
MTAHTFWFYGLSGAGKSTYTKILASHLKNKSIPYHILDGDEIREGLCADLGFCSEDRKENIRRLRYVCNLLNSHGINVLVAVITPYEFMRRSNRNLIKNYIEIFVDASIETCIKRDVKGLYKKALNGEIKNFTGFDDAFEMDTKYDIYIDTNNDNISECTSKMLLEINDLIN